MTYLLIGIASFLTTIVVIGGVYFSLTNRELKRTEIEIRKMRDAGGSALDASVPRQGAQLRVSSNESPSNG